MIDIPEQVTAHLRRERAIRPCHVNSASKAGFPCARCLVYHRLNWQEQYLPDIGLVYIFEEGNTHEHAVTRLLLAAGIDIIQAQRPLEWPELQVTGHIDGEVKTNGEQWPYEVKSSNQFTWEKLNTQADMKASTQIWVMNWYGQLQLYLKMLEQRQMILLLKNKQSGQLKQIEITVDQEYCDALAAKLRAVNEHVAAKTYPERIVDRLVCQHCNFRHLCLPDEESEQISITDVPELLEMLQEREELKQHAKDYEAVDKKLKLYWKTMKLQTYLVGGEFQVKLSQVNRSIYAVPSEIKDQYKENAPYTKATITKL